MTEPLYENDRPRLGSLGPVRVRVPAKINLFLGVGPLRPDGYHELTTVYQALALYDEVSARRGDQLTLTMEGEGAGTLPLEPYQLISQYTLEPLLKSVAETLRSVTVRYGCEFLSFEQDSHSVTAEVSEGGRTSRIAAKYLAGCDGGTSNGKSTGTSVSSEPKVV